MKKRFVFIGIAFLFIAVFLFFGSYLTMSIEKLEELISIVYPFLGAFLFVAAILLTQCSKAGEALANKKLKHMGVLPCLGFLSFYVGIGLIAIGNGVGFVSNAFILLANLLAVIAVLKFLGGAKPYISKPAFIVCFLFSLVSFLVAEVAFRIGAVYLADELEILIYTEWLPVASSILCAIVSFSLVGKDLKPVAKQVTPEGVAPVTQEAQSTEETK